MMKTPICDFVKQYTASDMIRFHMPGHKGKAHLGFEEFDITEIKGADALYEADGIIAQSEANATVLFGSQKTLYSAEGSSQCIRAMLYLAITHRTDAQKPVIVAARNVHKAFLYAAALLDIEVVWLWPEKSISLCGCPISVKQLENTLQTLETPPAAVYLTSPDYLGAMADIAGLSEVCHRHGTLLMVDNAHGAYLRFLQPSLHPLDLGADICCDSAHKTLPVLTGGAYLHLADTVPAAMAASAKAAMALFGSTSPSYLILASLDHCNGLLAGDYAARMMQTAGYIADTKRKLTELGWCVEESDPLRITLRVPQGTTGIALQQFLRQNGMECEYADDDFLVIMLTPDNEEVQLDCLINVLGKASKPGREIHPLPQAKGEQAVSIRKALFSAHEVIPVKDALGRICGAPLVSCPPAIPIVVSGERIGHAALELFAYYGITEVDVLKD